MYDLFFDFALLLIIFAPFYLVQKAIYQEGKRRFESRDRKWGAIVSATILTVITAFFYYGGSLFLCAIDGGNLCTFDFRGFFVALLLALLTSFGVWQFAQKQLKK